MSLNNGKITYRSDAWETARIIKALDRAGLFNKEREE